MSPPHTVAILRDQETPILVVQVDSGKAVGFGHVGRCLAIVEELGDRAAVAVCDESTAYMLRARGISVVPGDTPAPVLLVDRRAPTSTGEVVRMRERGRRVCLLDDRGSGRVSADVVIDPPTGCAWPPAGGLRLAGFEHVLLRRAVRAAANLGERGAIEVLVSMGASDPENLTAPIAAALRSAGMSVVSVVGPFYRGARPPGQILDSERDWPRALATAQLLVCRFGHTLIEAAHLGTPALTIATTSATAVEATLFASHGTAEAIQAHRVIDIAAVAQRVVGLLDDPARLLAMAQRGRELVDGHGARRVSRALEELARPQAPLSRSEAVKSTEPVL